MTIENHEHISSWEQQEKKNNTVFSIPTYLLAALLFVPSIEIKSEEWNMLKQQDTIDIYKEMPQFKEGIEQIVSYEGIFKDGIRKALSGINDISQIPVWGKHIDYFWGEWTLKGKKVRTESLQVMKLPEKFDISPRNITKPVSSMMFYLGNRKFSITPILWKIKNIYLTTEALVIETSILIDITYNKENKLPDLMFRLWMTPPGKWEKKWFKWTTVVEL